MQRIFIPILLIITNIVVSQDISTNDGIKWNSNRNKNVLNETLYFENVEFIFEGDNVIPLYTKKIEIAANQSVSKISISNQEFDIASSNEIRIIQEWNKKLEKISVSYVISRERNNNFIEI